MSDLRKKLKGKTSKLGEVKKTTKDHPASLDNYADGSFFNMDIELILPNPYQPRKIFDKNLLNDLTKSIKNNGVIQPVLIRKEEDKIFLVAGERRLRASKKAGLKIIPSIMTQGNPIEISLIENLQRDNLKPIEEAEALAIMIDKHQYTQQNLASALGKGRSTITETLSLNKLPEDIKDECRRADIFSKRLLVEVAKQKDEKGMRSLFKKIKKKELKSDDVKKLKKKEETDALRLLKKTQVLARSLGKIEKENINKEDEAGLIKELKKLTEIIAGFLN